MTSGVFLTPPFLFHPPPHTAQGWARCLLSPLARSRVRTPAALLGRIGVKSFAAHHLIYEGQPIRRVGAASLLLTTPGSRVSLVTCPRLEPGRPTSARNTNLVYEHHS